MNCQIDVKVFIASHSCKASTGWQIIASPSITLSERYGINFHQLTDASSYQLMRAVDMAAAAQTMEKEESAATDPTLGKDPAAVTLGEER
jgi:hypothetical protein